MPFGHARDQLLSAAVLLEELVRLEDGSTRTPLIGFVHNDDIGQVEHDDLLQLQSRAVIRIHDQYGKIDNSILRERHRFLTGADSFDNDVIKSGADQFTQTT